jgi:hypothetical protein
MIMTIVIALDTTAIVVDTGCGSVYIGVEHNLCNSIQNAEIVDSTAVL